MHDSSGNTSFAGQGSAESGALGARLADLTPDLQEVISAWEALPGTTKVGILAMVRAACH